MIKYEIKVMEKSHILSMFLFQFRSLVLVTLCLSYTYSCLFVFFCLPVSLPAAISTSKYYLNILSF